MPRRRSNPLALAVLACLTERPMHPYEMAATMRTRGQDQSIRLNYGSLYGVVENLLKRGLVEEHEVGAGRPAPRADRVSHHRRAGGPSSTTGWRNCSGRPAKEFPQFEAGLTLMGVLPPDRVVGPACTSACRRIAGARCSSSTSIVEAATRNGVPRMFLVEMDYERALVDADCAFTEQLAGDIESGSDWTASPSGRTSRRKGSTKHERDRRSRRHRPLVRRDPGAVRCRSVGTRRRSRRVARSERRGQDHPRPHPLHPDRARRGHRARRRLRRRGATNRGATLHRHSPGSTPRSTRRSPAARTSRWSGGCRACRRPSRPSAPPEVLERVSLTEAADRQLKTYSGGMRRRIDLGAGPRCPAARALARRTDDRPRPRQPARPLGLPARPGERGCDHPAHDAVPGGGRPARVRRRGHRPRHGHRDGHATRAQATARRRRARRHRRRHRARSSRRAARPTSAASVRPSTGARGACRCRSTAERAAWSRRCAGSTKPGSRWSTSRCAARRSMTCSSPSPGTPPWPTTVEEVHAR